MMDTLPKFVATPAPLVDAVDAIERGIGAARRACGRRATSAARCVLRGVLQPLTELQMRFSRDLPRALELADPARGGVEDQHAELGVSGATRRHVRT